MGNSPIKRTSLNNDNSIWLVNISTNLRKCFSLTENIDTIINKIFKYPNAIIAIEGLKDKKAIAEFYSNFYKRNNKEGKKYHIVPPYDEFCETFSASIDNPSSIITSWNSQSVGESYEKFQKVLISSYPFENHAYHDLYSPLSMLYDEYVLIANVKYKNFIFSMFSCSLTDDLLYIDNKSIRSNQLNTLIKVIQQNVKNLELKNCKNILLGNLSIPNINDGEVNNEYFKLVSDYPIIDLSSLLDIELSKKESYIMFVPTNKKPYLNKRVDQLNELLLKNDNIFVVSSDLDKLDDPASEIISVQLLLN